MHEAVDRPEPGGGFLEHPLDVGFLAQIAL
jgi:hypothetical protein